MERKLASIRRITNIEPIKGADFIVLATVDNWKAVVKKDEFEIGDLCVYCEVDSFLPIRPEFEFLRSSSYRKLADGTEGFRLRTMKLRKQISQGLVLPVSILPEYESPVYIKIYEGDDVTEQLGIVKYEPPIPAQLAGKVRGNFPGFVPKTNEERIQNMTKAFAEWKNHNIQFYETEKLDGSSATFYMKDGVFGVCSRNLDLEETEGNSFWEAARELDLETKMGLLDYDCAFQGELIGPGVQKNPYGLDKRTVKFYNIYSITDGEYVGLERFTQTLSAFQLDSVPILTTNFKMPETIDGLLGHANAKSVLNRNIDREGIVIRSFDREISFKVISNQFLLDNDE